MCRPLLPPFAWQPLWQPEFAAAALRCCSAGEANSVWPAGTARRVPLGICGIGIAISGDLAAFKGALPRTAESISEETCVNEE